MAESPATAGSTGYLGPSIVVRQRVQPVQPSAVWGTILAICTLAFALRSLGLAGLSLWGDYNYSVYAALQDLGTIARERVTDSHPPLYYYLLHFWIGFAGLSELSVRLLSALFGVLAVPLAFRLGLRLSGQRVGLIGALFVALSPQLVHYSREPRMYSLLVLLALTSLLSMIAALERDRARDWTLYTLVNCLLVYTHYYGVIAVAAEVGCILWLRKGVFWRRTRWLMAIGALAALYVPWLMFAAASAVSATAGIISNAPWPTELQGIVEQYWLPPNVGDFVDIGQARFSSLALLGVWIVGLVITRKQLRQHWRETRLLILALATPVAGSLILFAFVPYAVRPRFLIFVVPLYLVFYAAILCTDRRSFTWLAIVVMVAASGLALLDGYRMEPYVVEEDAILVTQRLERTANSDDAVVFHAFWQIGYFNAHYRGVRPSSYSLRDLKPDPETILSRHPRVWLAMFRSPVRSPNSLEEWLDRHWHRVEEVALGETRLVSYNRPTDDSWKDVSFQFETGEKVPLLRLTSVQLAHVASRTTGAVPIGLRWQAVRAIADRYTIFVHLVNGEGERVAGTDREPVSGVAPTAGWQAGKTVEDRTAVALPEILSPGDYSVRVGVYPIGNPKPLHVRGPDGVVSLEGITVGEVRIGPYRRDALRIRHPIDQTFGNGITLLGYDIDLDRYQVAATRMATAVEDKAIKLSFPKRSYRAGDTAEITMYWQADRVVNRGYTMFLHLREPGGQLAGQADSEPLAGRYPTSLWQAGEIVVDRYQIPMGQAARPGEYGLAAGMYLRTTLERVPVQGATTRTSRNEVELQRVRVENSDY